MHGFGRKRSIRETPAPYPGDARVERFPADTVLADLAGAEDEVRISRILARYAALRSWILSSDRAAPAVTRHAAEAARAHLEAVAPWAEGTMLMNLLDADLVRAAGLMALAAAEAEEAGDRAGAIALREGARDAMLLRLLESRRRRG